MDLIKQHRWVLVIHLPTLVQRNEDDRGALTIPPINQATFHLFPSFTMCIDCKSNLDEGWGNACWADSDNRMPDEFWSDLK